MAVAAFKRHENDASLNRDGIRALGSLSINDSNKVAIAAEDGIACLMNAIENHMKDKTVILEVYFALGHLAKNTANAVKIEKAGGLKIIFSAFKKHNLQTNFTWPWLLGLREFSSD